VYCVKPLSINCDFWRSRLMELSRGRLSDTERNGVSVHVGVCRDCSLFLEEQIALTTGLAELAADTVIAPPAELESIVPAEFDSTRVRRRRYFKPAAAIAAIAAALACCACLRNGHDCCPPFR
jgi:hypothetical protein